MAVLEINRNGINWSMCPMYPTCTRHERMKPIVFCYWDLHQHEKWVSPSPNWDGLPVGRHQNGHKRSEITFLSITQHLHVGSIETKFCFRMRSYLDHLAICYLPQLHEQVSMALETSGIGVCHK